MILKIKPNKNIYGKYFLATEAPDDEETVVNDEQPKPKRNVKVISVKPSSRGKDFTQVGNPPITPDTTEIDDTIDIDETDYTADDAVSQVGHTETQPTDPVEPTQGETTPTTEEPVVQTAPEDQPQTTDEPADEPETGNEDTTDFTNVDDQGDAEIADTGDDGPVTDDSQDFTSDDDTSTDASATDTANATTDTNKLTPPGVEFDSTRKYNLYKEYMSLYNAADNYISKLENILRDDDEENIIIRNSVTNLREIREILFDYMTIRFQLNTYVQSLLFYQKMVVAIQLVFRLLRSINFNKKK